MPFHLRRIKIIFSIDVSVAASMYIFICSFYRVHLHFILWRQLSLLRD